MMAVALAALAASVLSAPLKVNPPYPRIANCYGVGLTPASTPQDLREIARYDLLIGGVSCNWSDPAQRRKLAENIATVRRLNPYIIILDFSSSAPYADPADKSFPADGWLLQPDGKRVAGWPGTDMINLTKPDVIDWLVARSVASVRNKDFDGSFIDCMGSGFDSWACNIASGKTFEIDARGDGKPDDRAWLDAAWVKAKTELARRVREALGPKAAFMANQAGDWGYPYLNGILLEDYLDYVLDGRSRWDDVLRGYLHWTRTPHQPTVTTIVSSSGLQPPFDPWKSMTEKARTALLDRGRARTQRMRFGLTTTLMGDGYFAYDLNTRWRGQRWWYPEYDVPLGYPKGPAARSDDGTWRREFDGGTVVVNPTFFDAQVHFHGRRRDASSGEVADSFVVPSQDGRIFLPTDAAPRAGTLPVPKPAMTFEGSPGMVERGGRILLRAPGCAALLDDTGQVLRLTDGRGALVEGVSAFIVRDTRWQDFAYQDCQHKRLPGGDVEFTGRRTAGGFALEYREVVHLAAGEMMVRYYWRALTGGHVHMWRQQMDFPVADYGGGSFAAGDVHGVLPQKRAAQPTLVAAARSFDLTPPKGPRLTVETSADAHLGDERFYGVNAYRLGLYPASGDLKAGEQWSARFRLRWPTRTSTGE